jgi:hypothetical protein
MRHRPSWARPRISEPVASSTGRSDRSGAGAVSRSRSRSRSDYTAMMHSGLKLLAAGLPEVLPSRAAPDSRWGYPTAERVVGLLRAGGGQPYCVLGGWRPAMWGAAPSSFVGRKTRLIAVHGSSSREQTVNTPASKSVIRTFGRLQGAAPARAPFSTVGRGGSHRTKPRPCA